MEALRWLAVVLVAIGFGGVCYLSIASAIKIDEQCAKMVYSVPCTGESVVITIRRNRYCACTSNIQTDTLIVAPIGAK